MVQKWFLCRARRSNSKFLTSQERTFRIYVEFQTLDMSLTWFALIHMIGFLSKYINLSFNSTFCEQLNSVAKTEFSRKCLHPIRFYYTFLNRFCNFRAFKHVNSFLSNRFTIKSLNMRLLAPTFECTV